MNIYLNFIYGVEKVELKSLILIIKNNVREHKLSLIEVVLSNKIKHCFISEVQQLILSKA